MLVVFSPIFEAGIKIIVGYDSGSPLKNFSYFKSVKVRNIKINLSIHVSTSISLKLPFLQSLYLYETNFSLISSIKSDAHITLLIQRQICPYSLLQQL